MEKKISEIEKEKIEEQANYREAIDYSNEPSNIIHKKNYTLLILAAFIIAITMLLILIL